MAAIKIIIILSSAMSTSAPPLRIVNIFFIFRDAGDYGVQLEWVGLTRCPSGVDRLSDAVSSSCMLMRKVSPSVNLLKHFHAISPGSLCCASSPIAVS